MYDLIIKNGSIIDGTENTKPFTGDIAVKNGIIAAIAPAINENTSHTINAAGKTVTPGFIDIHRHCDAAVFRPNFGEIELRQGVTTVINGSCGLSIAPCPPKWKNDILQYLKPITGSLPISPSKPAFNSFSEYLSGLENISLPVNFGSHIGNGTLRMAATGFKSAPLQQEDYALIHHYLQDALEAGCFGVSMGLIYMPECMYNISEITKALQPIRGQNIPLVTHIRGEGNMLLQSLEEVITIARKLEVPLHISHFKCVGRQNWGHLLKQAIALIEEAASQGMTITCDCYPWTAGSTQLMQLLPPEYLEGGINQITNRLRSCTERQKCAEIMEKPQSNYESIIPLIGWENIMITSLESPKNQRYIGKRVTEIAHEKGADPYTCAFDLLAEENCNVSIVNFIACEEDITTILQYHRSFIISDSLYPDSGKPHPRQYGTFPKIIEEYVVKRKILTLEQAVYKFTGGPAKTFGIPGKGLLQEGMDADITVFDPKAIRCNADYTSPDKLAAGFSYVFIKGVLVNSCDAVVNMDAGSVLRRV